MCAKNTSRKLKRQPTDRQPGSANDVCDKDVVSRVQLNNTKTTRLKVGKDWKRHLSKDTQMANGAQGQITHVIRHQGNANQNHDETPPRPH